MLHTVGTTVPRPRHTNWGTMWRHEPVVIMVTMNSARTLSIMSLALAFGVSFAQQTADDHFKKISEIKPPNFDDARYAKVKSEYVKEYQQLAKKADAQRNEAILAFFQAFPTDSRMPDLLEKRWLSMFNASGSAKEILDDIATHSNGDIGEEMSAAIDYCKIYVRLLGEERGFKVVPAVLDFKKKHAKGPRFERLLQTTVYQVKDRDKKAIVEMFLKDFPDHRSAGMYKGILHQLDAVGKPFDLKFKDAVTGQDMSVAGLKGKVVMIDWWATWCGPCVEEMPHVKEIYAKYKDKGFEIVGVSLDNPEDKGGLTALKEFVAKNEVAWPQYYQGKGWDSEFSLSWGINSIPNVFLIDKKGVLRQVEVQDLESSLKKLLEEK